MSAPTPIPSFGGDASGIGRAALRGAIIGALVVGGVVGAIVLMFFVRGRGQDRGAVTGGLETTTALPAVDTTGLPAARAPVQEANSVGDYERLLAQGERVAGQRVHTVLYCGPMRSVTLTSGDTISPPIAKLADPRGQVPGAECKWGSGADAPELEMAAV